MKSKYHFLVFILLIGITIGISQCNKAFGQTFEYSNMTTFYQDNWQNVKKLDSPIRVNIERNRHCPQQAINVDIQDGAGSFTIKGTLTKTAHPSVEVNYPFKTDHRFWVSEPVQCFRSDYLWLYAFPSGKITIVYEYETEKYNVLSLTNNEELFVKLNNL